MQKPHPFKTYKSMICAINYFGIIITIIIIIIFISVICRIFYTEELAEKSNRSSSLRSLIHYKFKRSDYELFPQPNFSSWLHRAVTFWKEIKGCGQPVGKHGPGKTKSNFKEEGGEVLVH